MDETETKTIEEPNKIPEEDGEICKEAKEEIMVKQNDELIDSTVENSKSSPNGSEYESIDSAGNSSEEDGVKIDRHDSENEIDEHGSDSEGSVILEREEGDGQESTPSKKVDDDEDKKNPQYIPKRGTFYEHDDRTLDDGSDKQETPEKGDKLNKKNVWMEKKERWSHDRYNDNEQAPKSRAELVAIYGYDIRNEDGPPRARRRRRYGRGPNKYTRTWEDEDAYKPAKPVKSVLKKPRRKSQEEYPPLSNQTSRQSDGEQEAEDFENSKVEETSQTQTMKYSSETVDSNASVNDAPKARQELPNKKQYDSYEQLNNRPRVGTGRIVKPKPEIKKEIQDSDYRGFTKTRQFRNSKAEQKILPKGQKKDKRDGIPSQNNKQSSMQDIERDLNKMNIQDGGGSKNINKSNNQRQTSVPPRLQGEQKGSKRYSSLRQRSLPETAAPPFNQAANYYANDYNPQTQTSQQQQPLLAQPNAIHATAAQVPQIAPPPLPPIPQQVPVTATPILQAPPQFAAPFPQAPPAFLQPTVPPPPFLAQQPPQLINYVQGQQFPPPPPPYQGYQHQQFNTVLLQKQVGDPSANMPRPLDSDSLSHRFLQNPTAMENIYHSSTKKTQPAELYQCQGGTTYYSTQNQHITQRVVPQKRPKAAIPIVPPPPQEPRGRGRTSNQRETPPVGDEICENIANESSNNFEDAAVVVQQ